MTQQIDPTILIPHMNYDYLEWSQKILRDHTDDIKEVCRRGGVQTLIVLPYPDACECCFRYVIMSDKRSNEVFSFLDKLLEIHDLNVFYCRIEGAKILPRAIAEFSSYMDESTKSDLQAIFNLYNSFSEK